MYRAGVAPHATHGNLRTIRFSPGVQSAMAILFAMSNRQISRRSKDAIESVIILGFLIAVFWPVVGLLWRWISKAG